MEQFRKKNRTFNNLIFFYFLYFLYSINDYIIHNKKIEHKLWEHIKLELFYVSGKCKHTGNCCQNLALIIDKDIISYVEEWEKLVKLKPIYYYLQFCFSCLSSDKLLIFIIAPSSN